MNKKITRKVPSSRAPFFILSLLILAVILTIGILFWQTWKKESALPDDKASSSGTQAESFTGSVSSNG